MTTSSRYVTESQKAYVQPLLPYLVGPASLIIGMIAAGWTSKRTDALRRVGLKAAQRVDEARNHIF